MLPWIELVLGILLVTGILARYAALVSSILLIIFIIVTILNVFRGDLNQCGCFPESSILNSNNPFILVIRNYIFLVLGITIIVSRKGFKSRPLISIKGHVYDFIIFFAISFLLSILVISISQKRAEKIYLSAALNARQIINEKIKNFYVKQLPNCVLKDEDGRLLNSLQLSERYRVFLILDSFDCKTCTDEAIFIESLNKKFSNYINFHGIVGKIGQTAISNFKKSYSLTYTFFQDLDINLIKKFTVLSKSIKILVSPNGEILNIDPPTFRVKSFQNDYENLLENYLGKKGGD